MPRESNLRTAIVKELRRYSGEWFVIWQDGHQEKGLPDILGVYQGKFYALEVKRPGQLHTLSKKQAYMLEKIKRAGGRATVVTSVREALDFVFGAPI